MMVVHVKRIIIIIKPHNRRQGYFLTLQVSIPRLNLTNFMLLYCVSLFLLNCHQDSVGREKKIVLKKTKQKPENRKLYGVQQRWSHLFKMPLASENVMKSLAPNFILFFPVCLHFAVWIILKRASNNVLILCSVMELSSIVSGEGKTKLCVILCIDRVKCKALENILAPHGRDCRHRQC